MHVHKGGCKLGLKLLLKSEISHLEKGILKEVTFGRVHKYLGNQTLQETEYIDKKMTITNRQNSIK